jgi:hypothetical protein
MGHEFFKQLLENKAMTPLQGPDFSPPLEYRARQFSYFFCRNTIEDSGR